MSEQSHPDFTRMTDRDMLSYLCYESRHWASTEFVKDCLNEHEEKAHKKRSVPPGNKLPINKEKVIWIIACAIAAGASILLNIPV